MDGKAIIGFVDGTENPAVDENPYHFAVIGEEDADFAGGSYVFVQKYIHDMVAWKMCIRDRCRPVCCCRRLVCLDSLPFLQFVRRVGGW